MGTSNHEVGRVVPLNLNLMEALGEQRIITRELAVTYFEADMSQTSADAEFFTISVGAGLRLVARVIRAVDDPPTWFTWTGLEWKPVEVR